MVIRCAVAGEACEANGFGTRLCYVSLLLVFVFDNKGTIGHFPGAQNRITDAMQAQYCTNAFGRALLSRYCSSW